MPSAEATSLLGFSVATTARSSRLAWGKVGVRPPVGAPGSAQQIGDFPLQLLRPLRRHFVLMGTGSG
jgi:hypothetical protein